MAEQRKPYWELLRDPRWQEKRLRIMERDKFRCMRCGAKDQTLNVHHHFYNRGMKPWEYEDHQLSTLCESCHEQLEEYLTEIRRNVNYLDIRQIEYIRGLTNAMAEQPKLADVVVILFGSIIPEIIPSFKHMLSDFEQSEIDEFLKLISTDLSARCQIPQRTPVGDGEKQIS